MLGQISKQRADVIDEGIHQEALASVRSIFVANLQGRTWIFNKFGAGQCYIHANDNRSHEAKLFRYECEAYPHLVSPALANALGGLRAPAIVVRDIAAKVNVGKSLEVELAELYIRLLRRWERTLNRLHRDKRGLLPRVWAGKPGSVDHPEWIYLLSRAWWENKSIFSLAEKLHVKASSLNFLQKQGETIRKSMCFYELVDPACSDVGAENARWANLHVFCIAFRVVQVCIGALLESGIPLEQVLVSLGCVEHGQLPMIQLSEKTQVALRIWNEGG